ncbi:hypothetical protein KAW38_04265 [Candidatus Micrarchaeota archaeon]|nr:hypothetical protein [Candidatus Micrarchaeota archaeon]
MDPQHWESPKKIKRAITAFKEYISTLDLTNDTDIKKLGFPIAVKEFPLFKDSCGVFGGNSKEWYTSLPKLLEISGKDKQQARSISKRALELSLISLRGSDPVLSRGRTLLSFIGVLDVLDLNSEKDLVQLSQSHARRNYPWYSDACKYFGTYRDDWYGALQKMFILSKRVSEKDAHSKIQKILEIISRTSNEMLYSPEEAKREALALFGPIISDSATDEDFKALNSKNARKNPWFVVITNHFNGWYLFVDAVLEENGFPKEQRDEILARIKERKKQKGFTSKQVLERLKKYIKENRIVLNGCGEDKDGNLRLLLLENILKIEELKFAAYRLGGAGKSWYKALKYLLILMDYKKEQAGFIVQNIKNSRYVHDDRKSFPKPKTPKIIQNQSSRKLERLKG